MPWVLLLVSAVLEAVWATALGRSAGLTDPVPTAVFLVALALSTGGLALAVRTIPIGTGYAIWTGVGAALTVGYGDRRRALVAGQGAAHHGHRRGRRGAHVPPFARPRRRRICLRSCG